MAHAPRLVGFGLDFQGQPPATLERLKARFGHRLSHASIVAMSRPEEAVQFAEIFAGYPILHHLSGVAPADADGPHHERLAEQDRMSRDMGALWCGEDIGAWSIGPYEIPYFAPPPFDADVADLIGTRIADVMRRSSVPFLAEIPACSIVAGELSLGQFFHRLVERSGCRVCLDLSHVFAYALYMDQSPREVLASLPLDAVWQFHIAGGHADPSAPYYYVDSHAHPIMPEVMDLLTAAVPLCPELRAVTFEIAPHMEDDAVDVELTKVERALMALGYRSAIAPSFAS